MYILDTKLLSHSVVAINLKWSYSQVSDCAYTTRMSLLFRWRQAAVAGGSILFGLVGYYYKSKSNVIDFVPDLKSHSAQAKVSFFEIICSCAIELIFNVIQ